MPLPGSLKSREIEPILTLNLSTQFTIFRIRKLTQKGRF